jgi:hypothetical protein
MLPQPIPLARPRVHSGRYDSLFIDPFSRLHRFFFCRPSFLTSLSFAYRLPCGHRSTYSISILNLLLKTLLICFGRSLMTTMDCRDLCNVSVVNNYFRIVALRVEYCRLSFSFFLQYIEIRLAV